MRVHRAMPLLTPLRTAVKVEGRDLLNMSRELVGHLVFLPKFPQVPPVTRLLANRVRCVSCRLAMSSFYEEVAGVRKRDTWPTSGLSSAIVARRNFSMERATG